MSNIIYVTRFSYLSFVIAMIFEIHHIGIQVVLSAIIFLAMG